MITISADLLINSKQQKTLNFGGQQGNNSGFDISYKIYTLFVKFVYQ